MKIFSIKTNKTFVKFLLTLIILASLANANRIKARLYRDSFSNNFSKLYNEEKINCKNKELILFLEKYNRLSEDYKTSLLMIRDCIYNPGELENNVKIIKNKITLYSDNNLIIKNYIQEVKNPKLTNELQSLLASLKKLNDTITKTFPKTAKEILPDLIIKKIIKWNLVELKQEKIEIIKILKSKFSEIEKYRILSSRKKYIQIQEIIINRRIKSLEANPIDIKNTYSYRKEKLNDLIDYKQSYRLKRDSSNFENMLYDCDWLEKTEGKNQKQFKKYSSCVNKLQTFLNGIMSSKAKRFLYYNYISHLVLSSCTLREYKSKTSVCKQILKAHSIN